MGDLDLSLVIGGCEGLSFHIVTQVLQSGEAANVTVLNIDVESNRVEGARYVKGSFSSLQKRFYSSSRC